MVKTYNIYCDESSHLPNDGCPYMLLGYTCVPYPLVYEGKKAINDIKSKYEFKVTWTFWVIKWVEKIKGGHFG